MVKDLLLEDFKGRSLCWLVIQAPVDNALKQEAITNITILALGLVVEVILNVVIGEEGLAPDEVVGADSEGVHLALLAVLACPLLVLSTAEVGEEELVFAIAGEEEVVGLQVAVQN